MLLLVLKPFTAEYHGRLSLIGRAENGPSVLFFNQQPDKRGKYINSATSKDYCNTGCSATVGSIHYVRLRSEALYCPLVDMVMWRCTNSGSSVKIRFVTLSHKVDLRIRAVRRIFNPAYHCWLFPFWIITLTRETQLVVCHTQALEVTVFYGEKRSSPIAVMLDPEISICISP